MSLIQININLSSLPLYRGNKIVSLIGSEKLLGKELFKNKFLSFKLANGKRVVKNYLRERDGDACCWCQRIMSFNIKPSSKYYPTIEHLKRKCEGGSNSLDNLALAHKFCNNERHK